MKKSLIIAITLLLAVITASAQDKIITKDGKQLAVKVEKIDPEKGSVEYHDWDNLTGPIFVLSKEKVATILFENGNVYVFEETAETSGKSESKYDSAGLPKAVEGVSIIKYNDDDYRLGDIRMDEDQLERFLQTNCTPAYERFRTGVQLKRTGWALFGVGAGLCAVGMALTCSGLYATKYTYDSSKGWDVEEHYINNGLYIPGAILLSFGSAAWTASIPLLAVGIHKKDHAYETYNEQCSQKRYSFRPEFQLNLKGGDATGLGFALNF